MITEKNMYLSSLTYDVITHAQFSSDRYQFALAKFEKKYVLLKQ